MMIGLIDTVIQKQSIQGIAKLGNDMIAIMEVSVDGNGSKE